jgi:hypothetical protein
MKGLLMKLLVGGFIMFVAILGFVFVGGQMGIFPLGNVLLDVVTVSLFGFFSAIVLIGVARGDLLFFLVTLVSVGIIFVLCASAVTVPYTFTETFSQPASRDFTPYVYSVYPPYGNPYENNDPNRSLLTFELPVNSTKLFTCWSHLISNVSVFEINVSSTFGWWLTLSVVGINEVEGIGYTATNFYFQKYFMGFSSQNSSAWLKDWVSWYWTPPDTIQEQTGLLFSNLSNDTILFRFNVREYYEDTHAVRQVTKYSSLLNPDFVYVGLGLIVSATCLEVFSRMMDRKRKPLLND